MSTWNDTSGFMFAMEGYFASDLKDKAGDDTIHYYGFLNKYGNWYIIEKSDTPGTIRYYKGDSDYSTAWTGRETAPYNYFHTIFK